MTETGKGDSMVVLGVFFSLKDDHFTYGGGVQFDDSVARMRCNLPPMSEAELDWWLRFGHLGWGRTT